MNENSPFFDIEKSLENFNSSLSSIEKAYGKISRKIDEYSVNNNVPREYLKEMAGNLAHEIRNPLGGIANLVELLLQDSEGRQARNIQGILDGVSRIDKIVENLIIFSRPVVVKSVNCNLHDILNRAVATVQLQLGENASLYQFSVSQSDHELYIKIDPVLMLQAIQNVLHNATEVMPEGGEIVLAVAERQQESELEVTISDEGPGFHGEHEEKPFYPFYTTKTNGMGLGLPTSRLIVEKHDGKIWLRNRPDKGVTVTIKLPVS